MGGLENPRRLADRARDRRQPCATASGPRGQPGAGRLGNALSRRDRAYGVFLFWQVQGTVLRFFTFPTR
jgi:hypothetical protein